MRFLLGFFIFVLVVSAAHAQQDSSIIARSASRLTMLAYGLGEDRLGGAKAGYIDSNVLLRIIDSTRNLYKVKLSQSHVAYINKAEVKPGTARQKAFYLTNSWSIRGDENYDYVNINLDERLPYKSWMEIGPSKILVDIYGVQSNSNWINQLKNVKEIRNVYFNQVEDDVVRVTIELIHQQHWGYSINYTGNTLSIRVRRQPKNLRVRKLLVAIDAGHGGTNAGATGINTKAQEKNYTLRFATELEKYLLRKNAGVVMTRTTDTTFATTDRVLLLQDVMPHVLISIHLNSSGLPAVQGVSTYYKHIGFRPLSQAVLHQMLELDLHEFGNVGNFNFTLNAPTDFPNTLVEVAFLSNPEDEKRILDPRFHKQVAKKIYKGLRDWLRQVRRSS
jgi:N-acetylmuramoyl-L-alanine amidase